jgi:methyl coenzyme M reductase subunit C
MRTFDGGQLIFALLDCAAILDFVSKDFKRRFSLTTRKSHTNIVVRLAYGQRVTSSTVCDITFELARHEYQGTFYVFRDLRVVDIVLGFVKKLCTHDQYGR